MTAAPRTLIAAAGTGCVLLAGCAADQLQWVETVHRPEARLAALTAAVGGRSAASDGAWYERAAAAGKDACTVPLLVVEHSDRKTATVYFHDRCR